MSASVCMKQCIMGEFDRNKVSQGLIILSGEI